MPSGWRGSFTRCGGEAGRTKFLSLKKGYHGTHTGGASVNGNANFRMQYEPLLPGCFHIPAPYTYRNPFNETDPERLAQLCLSAFEDEIAFQGAGTIAAFVMEPVLGAGGVIPPHASFMPGVREICDRNGILLIADEVITGYGRTGSWTGSRHWGVKPDFSVTAKAITNGYFPFGAVMIADHVAEVFEEDETGRANVASGYTYSGHPVGAAAALACLAETQRLKVNENAAARGAELFAGLKGLAEKYDVVGDVRGGEGLMCALELVSDPAAKTPLDSGSIKTGVRCDLCKWSHGACVGAEPDPVTALGSDGRRCGPGACRARHRFGSGLRRMAGLPDHAPVVIIGGGIIGVSTAYHLAHRGVPAVLLERRRLASGTTWHAAGIVGQLRDSTAQTELGKYTARLFRDLEEETGQGTGYKQNGTINLALGPVRHEQLLRSHDHAGRMGINSRMMSPDEIAEIWPGTRDG